MGVLADQAAAAGAAGHREVDVAREAGAGAGHVAVTLLDARRVVLEPEGSVEVAERAGLPRRGDGCLTPVEGARPATVAGVVEADLRVCPGVGVDLRDAVRALVGLQGGLLGGTRAERGLVRQDDALVLGAGSAVHRVAEERLGDPRPARVVQVDGRVRDARTPELGRHGADGAVAVVHHQHLQVDARILGGRRPGRDRPGRDHACRRHRGGRVSPFARTLRHGPSPRRSPESPCARTEEDPWKSCKAAS